MVSIKTKLKVADNSGAQICQCIRIYGGSIRRRAVLGDRILLTIKKFKHTKRIKRKKETEKKVYFGLIVATKLKTKRKDGHYIKYDSNKVLMFNFENKFLGTRIYSPLCKELRGGKNEVKYKQIITYSRTII
jgi:large subunit ribosomal protein L14